jgi:hypothetical protein
MRQATELLDVLDPALDLLRTPAALAYKLLLHSAARLQPTRLSSS